MRRMILGVGVLASALTGLFGGAAPAVAQDTDRQLEAFLRNLNRVRTPYSWDWVGDNAQFNQPVYLVQCVATCPGDGLMLVPDPDVYRQGVLRRLGGPYQQRLDIELDRNRLVPAGLPGYALRVHVFDWVGDEVGAFWWGSRPECGTPDFADGPLTGDVSADFSPPPPGRPEAFPIPVDWGDYERAVAELRPECRRNAENARPLGN